MSAIGDRIARIRGLAAGIADPASRLDDADLVDALRDGLEAQEVDPAKAHDWRAAHNLVQVERLSLAGVKVADIARTLQLSQNHVVALRRRLGVSKRR